MSVPPSAESVRRNMRTYGTGRTCVYAKRFKPFVMSQYGYTVHRTHAVLLKWGNSGGVFPTAYFECRGADNHTSSPVFLDTPDEIGSRRCAKCFP